ncbi:hypothetical protein NRK82_000368 [Escherichia coli]|nr:hypothetical protein [Escherichia coli]
MKNVNYRIEKRHINEIKPGDTVLRGGELWTVTSRELMKAGYRRYIASLKARIEELEKPKPTFWQRLKDLF